MAGNTKKFFIAAIVITAAIYLDGQNETTRQFLIMWLGLCYAVYIIQKIDAKIPKETLYKCTFHIDVITPDDKLFCYLHVSGFLPFPPFKGLHVHTNNYPLTGKFDGEDNRYGDFEVGFISSVRWNNGGFECTAEPYQIDHTNQSLFFDSITSRHDAPWKINALTENARASLAAYIASLEIEAAEAEGTDGYEWHLQKLERVKYQVS